MTNPTQVEGEKRKRGIGVDLIIGLGATVVLTGLGYVSDRLDFGFVARVFLWPSYLLWKLLRSQFIEQNALGTTVYAGFPYLFIWLFGILMSFPIYVLASWGIRHLWHRYLG